MIIYVLVGSLLLLFILFRTWKSLNSDTRQQDSALKKRAIFNLSQQITYARLKEILPQHIILAHVSFDALLTTKYSRTRHKYRNMVADFVVLDEHHQVSTIIALNDPLVSKRSQNLHYQDALLVLAGYRVIRYDDVPEDYQLRHDLLSESSKEHWLNTQLEEKPRQYGFYSDLERKKAQIWR